MPQHAVRDIPAPPLDTLTADRTLGEALEYMFRQKRSPIGITDGDSLDGVVTFQSVARALLLADRLSQDDSLFELPVGFALDRSFPRIDPDEELFALFDILADSRFVIVTPLEETHHVIRDVDFHQFLQHELEEFLVIEEIERTIRTLLRTEFDADLDDHLHKTFADLEELRTPATIDECSFRHYSIFISQHWETLEHRFEHRPDFIRDLIDRVGDIRNRLFHFRTDDTGPTTTIDTELLAFAREHFHHVALPDQSAPATAASDESRSA